MACLFAATYPERTAALVLFQPAVTAGHGGHPKPPDRDAFLRMAAEVRDRWGEREFCDELLAREAPSLAADAAERAWFADWCRLSASPSMAYALMRAYYDTDLTNVLPAIHVPTLVLHRGASSALPARDVGERLRDVRLVAIPGEDAWGMFLSPEIPDEIERFVTGAPAAEEPDRVLATLLFTDLVESSARAAALGDAEWSRLLERHHAAVRRELARHRGREVNTAGDAFFSTFDGPARAIRCAAAIRDALRALDLDVRAGVHTGECELVDDEPAGVAVHAAARICAAATAGEILVSNTVKDLVAGSGLLFEDRGVHRLRGIPDAWPLHAVRDP
jgi:class 3 adenylate cyclase